MNRARMRGMHDRLLQGADKLLLTDAGLPKDSSQGSRTKLAVHRDHADVVAASHDRMAAALVAGNGSNPALPQAAPCCILAAPI
jgi:hypothetical protein